MQRIAALAVLAALGALVLGAGHAMAQATAPGAGSLSEPEPLIANSPRRARPLVRVRPVARARPVVRERPRISVRPLYPYRRYHSLYPVPYDFEYPGPNAKRECAARYVTEYRLSGPVVVPRMNCWWVRG